MAFPAMTSLNPLWKSTINFSDKIKLYKPFVVFVQLYRCESWTLQLQKQKKKGSRHFCSSFVFKLQQISGVDKRTCCARFTVTYYICAFWPDTSNFSNRAVTFLWGNRCVAIFFRLLCVLQIESRTVVVCHDYELHSLSLNHRYPDLSLFGLTHSTSTCKRCRTHYCLGQSMYGNLFQVCQHCRWSSGLLWYVVIVNYVHYL